MKAPDKIYIPIIEEDGKKLLCTKWWETDTSSRNAYVNETIPYIRKDALLEWAKEKAEDYKGAANIRRSFEMMIRKIESL